MHESKQTRSKAGSNHDCFVAWLLDFLPHLAARALSVSGAARRMAGRTQHQATVVSGRGPRRGEQSATGPTCSALRPLPSSLFTTPSFPTLRTASNRRNASVLGRS
eukprot:scaffold1833_cov255-Pinguiococcus_pyrenoidosus.AAC.22